MKFGKTIHNQQLYPTLTLDDHPHEQPVLILDRNGRHVAMVVISDWGVEANVDVYPTRESHEIRLKAFSQGCQLLGIEGLEGTPTISIHWDK